MLLNPENRTESQGLSLRLAQRGSVQGQMFQDIIHTNLLAQILGEEGVTTDETKNQLSMLFLIHVGHPRDKSPLIFIPYRRRCLI